MSSASPISPPRLSLEGVSKSFGGVQALADVSFSVALGEVHAVLGENGAGKSTLVKIITGIHPADRGEIRLDGRVVRFPSPLAARAAGIVAVYQDPKLSLTWMSPKTSSWANIRRHGLGRSRDTPCIAGPRSCSSSSMRNSTRVRS